MQMEIKHAERKVMWQDHTYDQSRTCSMCMSRVCEAPVHPEAYREVGTTRLEEEATDSPDYWQWMDQRNPYGGDGSALSTGGDYVHNEAWAANPDQFEERGFKSSGVTEQQYEWMQEALSTLTDRRQQIWDLAMRQQLSQTEIASQLGVSQQTVEEHLRLSKQIVTEFLRTKQDETSA
jgi:RNA polymerase sigma factor (sigma-70 family)